jgi:hypothetical protein
MRIAETTAGLSQAYAGIKAKVDELKEGLVTPVEMVDHFVGVDTPVEVMALIGLDNIDGSEGDEVLCLDVVAGEDTILFRIELDQTQYDELKEYGVEEF